LSLMDELFSFRSSQARLSNGISEKSSSLAGQGKLFF